ncbi:hypothetical protein Asulf_01130 [Archaeoglobus sulfaticallidus PM70-1]|uniref:Restriction endonuclease type IV Mrr domain-containing protein n=1 Tax=Archaeoglobus sulfaticallidus PM70-1 TaxID=387631 RepID=N0BLN2_9EURY|nr:restriction endonuclease [Archaeoglobus sulfaticallidus]AGK61130.1 hypothetical protein Asulf_01130 [Archaeoglobus sulfaticallidus PM70-1]
MPSWQEFEELVKDVFEKNDFETRFRVVFRYKGRRSEIDIIAKRFNKILAVDAKRYNRNWYRKSALKREAEKHRKRCENYSKLTNQRVYPVIVSLIDDRLIFYEGCAVVPFDALNDFLLNIDYYLAELFED